MFSSPLTIFMTPAGLDPGCQYPSCTGEPKVDTVLQTQSCKCQIESKDHLPGSCSFMFNLSTKTPRPFLQSCFLNSPKPLLMQGITPFTPSQIQDFMLLLLNFMWFLSAYFYSSSSFLWIAALLSSISTAPPSLVLSTNFPRTDSVPSSRSSAKALVTVLIPVGHPVVASQYLDFADHNSHSGSGDSFQPTFSSLYVTNLVLRLIDTVWKALMKSR